MVVGQPVRVDRVEEGLAEGQMEHARSRERYWLHATYFHLSGKGLLSAKGMRVGSREKSRE